MTSKERILRAIEHKETDRIPIFDVPWAGTLRRWRMEGMPSDVDFRDYFDIDKTAEVWVDISPRYEKRILEQTERYSVVTTNWGATLRQFNALDATPDFLSYSIDTPEKWEEAKARMLGGDISKVGDTDGRIAWEKLKNEYPIWQKEGRWIEAQFWFGFDVTHSWMCGLEPVLCGMYEDPDWISDMFNTYLDMDLVLFDKILKAGYRFDCIRWPDDMGYKGTTFFSPAKYRELLKPVHKRACDWAHERGLKVRLHSCGDIMTLIPDLVEIGVDCLNPLEIKAGMEPITLKREYGDKLAFHGGINAALFDRKDAVIAEIERLVPPLMQNGGYIFSSDHSIPNSVSLDDFGEIIGAVKRVGRF